VTGTVHVFGVRHHGPGSARSLVGALEALAPDAILIEGPPDAQEIIGLAARAGMEPPVAILVYAADDPRRAVFYPFAAFSPEWQAIHHGIARQVPVRFIDLPQAHRLAESLGDESGEEVPFSEIRADPLSYLAHVAGYRDGERWWDHVIESREAGGVKVFDAVREAMDALREAHPENETLGLQREAHMRQAIRAALKEGFERIAVVCGAWHAPALSSLPPASADAALLKGLAKVKTRAAWVPWSYERLAFRSGYGAGVESPEWYHLLWEEREEPVLHWMTRMARLLRDRDLDASSAHVIEAVRLARTLATLRGRALPGLDEMLEAALSVVCGGAPAPLQLIERKLVFGERLGHVPDDLPLAPLQEDLAREQKRLRLAASADHKDYDLDLRTPTDLARSALFHRLRLLDISWAEPAQATVRSAGTFHEFWRLQWKPEFAIAIVDAARWGGTIEEASTMVAVDRAAKSEHVEAIAALLEAALLGDLPLAVERILVVLGQRAAVSRDVVQLMDALVPLARSRRYGSVRQTDGAVLDEILHGCIERIAIGLPSACASLDDEAAAGMIAKLGAVDNAVVVLDAEENLATWRAALVSLAGQEGLHALVAGRVARLLHDAGAAAADETATRLSLALSAANDPLAAAHWIEGFASGSGVLLTHDDAMWGLVDGWLAGLAPDHFVSALPLLRRTFATFAHAERRQIGERARRGMPGSVAAAAEGIVAERAMHVLPVLKAILAPRGAP
jgi:hypothetical protein